MATPALTVQTKNVAFSLVANGTPTEFTGTVLDADGNPLDIGTGYTGRIIINNNPSALALSTGTDMLSQTYNADGTFVLPLNSAGVQKLPNGTRQYVILMSNDAFTTSSIAYQGSLTCNRMNA